MRAAPYLGGLDRGARAGGPDAARGGNPRPHRWTAPARSRHLSAGLGLATGAVLMLEAVRQTVDVAWIPGIGVLDQTWLLVNGLLAALIGYVAMKRR